MKYLIDEALIVESVVTEEVNEATGKKEKNYYIEGVFSTPGQKNRNGRIYPLSLWEKEVTKYQDEIKNNTMNTLGEWEHPPRTHVDPLQAVMKIVEIKMDNGLVMGKAKILNNNSEKTNQLKSLIDEGMKIGVSSRGVGTVNSGIVENFSLTTFDLTACPSDYNSNLAGLRESLENSVEVSKTHNIPINEEQITYDVQEIHKATKQKFKEILESLKIDKTRINEEYKPECWEDVVKTLQNLKTNVSSSKSKDEIDSIIGFIEKSSK